MSKKSLFFVLKLGVTVALLAWLASKLDLDQAFARIVDLAPVPALAAVCLIVALSVNNTYRWMLVMRAIEAWLPFPKSFRILYIGLFFNQTLPSAVGGDAVRMYLAYKAGLELKGAINGVMLERLATVTGLVALVLVAQPFLLARIGDNAASWAFPALAVLLVLGALVLMQLDRVPERFTGFAVIRGLAQLARDTRRLFFSPVHGLGAVGLGVFGNIVLALIGFALARSLGLGVTLLDCLVLIPPVILVTTLPISLAGWGVREVAMVFAFGFIGVSETDATVLSVLFGLTAVVGSLPGGVLWLTGGYKRREVTDEAASL